MAPIHPPRPQQQSAVFVPLPPLTVTSVSALSFVTSSTDTQRGFYSVCLFVVSSPVWSDKLAGKLD